MKIFKWDGMMVQEECLMQVRFAITLLLLALFSATPTVNIASGADIAFEVDDDCATVRITGQIQRGDFDEFEKGIKECKTQNRYIGRVFLQSAGGDVLESVKIGRLVRELKTQTLAPLRGYNSFDFIPCNYGQPCTCNSACFLIWAAGVRRWGNALGLHRPTFKKEYFAGLTADQAKMKYDMMSDEVRKYLQDMGIPNSVIETIWKIPSGEIKFLSKKSAESLEKVAWFDEWVSASCESLSQAEWDDFKSPERSNLSKAEEEYSTKLFGKWTKYEQCLEQKLKEEQLKK